MRANHLIFVVILAATFVLATASTALATWAEGFEVNVVTTDKATFIFLTPKAEGSHGKIVRTNVAVYQSTLPQQYEGWRVADDSEPIFCRNLAIHLGIARLVGQKEVYKKEAFDVILQDNLFRVSWNTVEGDVTSPSTRDVHEAVRLEKMATSCCIGKPTVEVRRSAVPDKIKIVIVGKGVIWSGRWGGPPVHAPIRPGEEFPDERTPLPAPGQPGWDIF